MALTNKLNKMMKNAVTGGMEKKMLSTKKIKPKRTCVLNREFYSY